MKTKFSRGPSEHVESIETRQQQIQERRRRHYEDLILCVAIFLMVAAVALAVQWM